MEVTSTRKIFGPARPWRAVALIALVGAVSACGGGGGGDDDAPSVSTRSAPTTARASAPTPPPPPPLPPVERAGFAVAGEGVENQTIPGRAVTVAKPGPTSLVAVRNPERSSLVIRGFADTDPDSGILSVKASDGTTRFDSSATGKDSATVTDRAVSVRTNSGKRWAFFSKGKQDKPLQYQTFGSWQTRLGTPEQVAGVGSFGSRTHASKMPSGTTARYSGESVGYAVGRSGAEFDVFAEAEIETDFNAVTFNTTNTVVGPFTGGGLVPVPDLDLSGSGRVSGNTFSAAVSGAGVAGSADGRFYGPNAEELGGTFQTSTSDGITYVGAFGTTRQ